MALVECAWLVLGIINGFYYIIYSSKYLFSILCTILFLGYVLISVYFHYCQIRDYRHFSDKSEDIIDRDGLEEKYDDKEEALIM